MEINEKLNLKSYYYGFSETGVRTIDLVLRAVSAAGKTFHHTDEWTSEIDYTVENVRGPAPVDWIQNAADDAAEAHKKLIATLATTQAALEAKERECERLRKVCNDWGSNYQSWVDGTKKAESERDTALTEVERLRGELNFAASVAKTFEARNELSDEEYALWLSKGPDCLQSKIDADNLRLRGEILRREQANELLDVHAIADQRDKLLSEVADLRQHAEYFKAESDRLRGEVERLQKERSLSSFKPLPIRPIDPEIIEQCEQQD